MNRWIVQRSYRSDQRRLSHRLFLLQITSHPPLILIQVSTVLWCKLKTWWWYFGGPGKLTELWTAKSILNIYNTKKKTTAVLHVTALILIKILVFGPFDPDPTQRAALGKNEPRVWSGILGWVQPMVEFHRAAKRRKMLTKEICSAAFVVTSQTFTESVCTLAGNLCYNSFAKILAWQNSLNSSSMKLFKVYFHTCKTMMLE